MTLRYFTTYLGLVQTAKKRAKTAVFGVTNTITNLFSSEKKTATETIDVDGGEEER